MTEEDMLADIINRTLAEGRLPTLQSLEGWHGLDFMSAKRLRGKAVEMLTDGSFEELVRSNFLKSAKIVE